METLFSNDFIIINYDSSKLLLETIRTKESDRMNIAEYKETIEKWAVFVQSVCPKYQLVDQRDFKFPISTELQDWVNKTLVIPAAKLGIKKIAFIESPDFFTQISIEQTMADTMNSLPFQVKYFSDNKLAYNWLLEE